MERSRGSVDGREIKGDGTIILPIQPVVQTRDACVSACVKAVITQLDGLEAYTELTKLFEPFVVGPENNPHANPDYIKTDGILYILQSKYAVEVHRAGKGPYKSSIGSEYPFTTLKYSNEEFTYDSFVQYVSGNLKTGKYLLPWLYNPLYNSEIIREYDQHVVVIHGINIFKETVHLMDPDMFLSEEEHKKEYPLRDLFHALWRREGSLNSRERIIVIGEKNAIL